MDKEISKDVIRKRKRNFAIAIITVLGVLIFSVGLVRSYFKPTLKKSEIITATVEVGNVENTLTASGEILPEFEQVITSPINSTVQSVLTDAGTVVKEGTQVLTLDRTATEVEYERLRFQLESKKNSIEKLKLELRKSFYDLQSNNDIKQLKINSLEASLEDAKRLFKAGGATREDVAKCELDLKVARLEKKQLENEIRNKQQTMQKDMRESELAAAIQESELRELERKLSSAMIIARRGGVVTWVNKNIGATVSEGEALARIADLKSFRVAGSIGDTYINQLQKGMRVIVRINDTNLGGLVSNISPAIQNNIVSFDIRLDEPNHKLYRPNMKVDVFLVTDSRANVNRVANGPAFKGTNLQDIFIVRGDKAERRTVRTGLSNFDYVEITDVVKPGDVVITSDMSEYKNVREITIEN